MSKTICLFLCIFSFPFNLSLAYGGILVDTSWLRDHLKEQDIRVLDVSRDPAFYEKRHIPGARQVFRHRDLEDYTRYPPVGFPEKRQFLALMRRLGISNKTMVVAYDDNRGLYASRMIFLMQLYGHPMEKLKILNGGIKQWVEEGLPVEEGSLSVNEEAKPYRPGKRRGEYLATWQDIYRKVVQERSKKFVLLDVRPEAEYDGDKVRLVRGGHIPGAVNLEVAAISLGSGGHLWETPERLEAIFQKEGVSKDKTIIIYCHSGDRSAHAFVILKDLLYYPDVRIYEGAWEEWAVLQALPVEE